MISRVEPRKLLLCNECNGSLTSSFKVKWLAMFLTLAVCSPQMPMSGCPSTVWEPSLCLGLDADFLIPRMLRHLRWIMYSFYLWVISRLSSILTPLTVGRGGAPFRILDNCTTPKIAQPPPLLPSGPPPAPASIHPGPVGRAADAGRPPALRRRSRGRPPGTTLAMLSTDPPILPPVVFYLYSSRTVSPLFF